MYAKAPTEPVVESSEGGICEEQCDLSNDIKSSDQIFVIGQVCEKAK